MTGAVAKLLARRLGLAGRVGLAGRLGRDITGAVAIETAIITPVLALMAIGAYQVSALVARQQELQSGAAEAAAIAFAKSPTTAADRTTLHDIIKTSLELADDQVTVTNLFRCGTADVYATDLTACGPEEIVSTYIHITITDTYVPQWTAFGVGEPVTLNVTRTVQIS